MISSKHFVFIFAIFAFLGALPGWGGLYFSLALIFGVVIPLKKQGEFQSGTTGRLFYPLVFIILVMSIRFVLDASVSSVIVGPWKVEFMSGLLYLIYFSFNRQLTRENMYRVVKLFILVSSAVSVYNILQVTFPVFSVIEGTRSEVGGIFVRYQTVYYHFSVLSIVFIVYLLTNLRVGKRTFAWYVFLALLNLSTITINGYRATIFVLVACLGIYMLTLWSQIKISSKVWIIILAIPFLSYLNQYVEERNAETFSDEHGDSSLMYRLLEAGYGIEKIANDGTWIWGAGYAEGFDFPWGPVGDQGQTTFFLHNGYVSILYNYGVAGLIAWLSLIVWILVIILRNYSACRRNPLYVLLTLYLIGQLVVNYSSGIFNREPAVTMCFFLAIVMVEKLITYSESDNVQWSPIPLEFRRRLEHPAFIR